MKRKVFGPLTIMLASALLIVSCSTTEGPLETTGAQNLAEKEGLLHEVLAKSADRISQKGGASTQGALTYTAEICEGTYAGTSVYAAIDYPDEWTYYKFEGNAGDVITITVNRTSCAIDPAFTLFEGLGTTTTGLAPNASTSTELSFLTWRDDDIAPALGCGQFYDPFLDGYVLPTTGWYTIAVYNFAGYATGPYEYDLVLEGVTCDADGDGVDDDDDPYPNSDTQANVTIDGCDSNVENQYLGDGTYMMDKILDCKNDAANHGAFVSCLSKLTNEWKKDGLISGANKGSISSCGAGSNWP